MKVWEETWYWDDEWSEVVTRYPDTEEYQRVGLVGKNDRTIVETDSGCYPPREGERELIVAAPEMARLLLELEWKGEEWDYGGGESCCPCCYEKAPQTVHFPAKRIDAYTRTEARDEVFYGKHKDDCQWVAVLTKAGVLRHGDGDD